MGSKIVLGYSGTLNHFNGKPKRRSLRDLFWTYHHDHTDSSTRSPYYLFHAVQKLHLEKRIGPEQFRMDFWGLIDPQIMELARELKIEQYLKVEGYCAKEKSLAKLAACTVLFLPLESTGLGEPLFIPGKIFEYLKSEKPILALCEPQSDAGSILVNSGTAIICQGSNVDEIAGKLEQMINDPDSLASYQLNKSYLEQFKWEQITKKMADVFKACLNNDK